MAQVPVTLKESWTLVYHFDEPATKLRRLRMLEKSYWQNDYMMFHSETLHKGRKCRLISASGGSLESLLADIYILLQKIKINKYKFCLKMGNACDNKYWNVGK